MLSSKNDSRYSPTPDRPCLLANGSGIFRFACTSSQSSHHDTITQHSKLTHSNSAKSCTLTLLLLQTIHSKWQTRLVVASDITLQITGKTNRVNMKICKTMVRNLRGHTRSYDCFTMNSSSLAEHVHMQMADLLDGQQNLLLDPASGKQCWSNECLCQWGDVDITEASFLEAKSYPPWTGSLIVHSHTQRHSVICHK